MVEQLGGFHALRNEESRFYSLFQDIFPGEIIQTEIILGIQDSDDIVLCFLADRIVAVAVLVNDTLPVLHRIFCIQYDHVSTMGTDLFSCNIMKFKNILDKFIFLGVNNALGVSLHEHHLDFFLCHLIVIFGRIDPEASGSGLWKQ